MKNKAKFKRELFSKKKDELSIQSPKSVKNSKNKNYKEEESIQINIPTPYPKNVSFYKSALSYDRRS